MADYREEIKKYEMIYDHHTHTVFSHGSGTIEDNVKAAWEKGLQSIAITDHGPGHLTYGLKRDKIPEMKERIKEAQLKYPQVKVFLGVEANTLRKFPYIDVPLKDRIDDGYDLVLAGYHYGVLHGGTVENWLHKHVFCRGEKECVDLKHTGLLTRNTEMIVSCLMENYKEGNGIDILTHPGDKGPFDLEEIAKACEKTNTLMEINGKHPHLSVEEMKLVSKYNVRFVISSDAHSPQWVGEFRPQLERALKAKIEPERIVNIRRK